MIWDTLGMDRYIGWNRRIGAINEAAQHLYRFWNYSWCRAFLELPVQPERTR